MAVFRFTVLTGGAGAQSTSPQGRIEVGRAGGVTGFVDLESGRRFVRDAAVADVVGCSTHELHHRLIPVYWGVPGNWRWLGGQTFYALDSLPELVSELILLGRVAAAERLEVWLGSVNGGSERRGWLQDWEDGHE